MIQHFVLEHFIYAHNIIIISSCAWYVINIPAAIIIPKISFYNSRGTRLIDVLILFIFEIVIINGGFFFGYLIVVGIIAVQSCLREGAITLTSPNLANANTP